MRALKFLALASVTLALVYIATACTPSIVNNEPGAQPSYAVCDTPDCGDPVDITVKE